MVLRAIVPLAPYGCLTSFSPIFEILVLVRAILILFKFLFDPAQNFPKNQGENNYFLINNLTEGFIYTSDFKLFQIDCIIFVFLFLFEWHNFELLQMLHFGLIDWKRSEI